MAFPRHVRHETTVTDRPLYEQRAELVSSLLGSTTERAQELGAFLNEKLLAWEARAAGASASAAKRSEKVRAPIRLAIGRLLLPAGLSERAAVAIIRRRLDSNRKLYGIEELPDDEVIRDEFRLVKSKGDVSTVVVPGADDRK